MAPGITTKSITKKDKKSKPKAPLDSTSLPPSMAQVSIPPPKPKSSKRKKEVVEIEEEVADLDEKEAEERPKKSRKQKARDPTDDEPSPTVPEARTQGKASKSSQEKTKARTQEAGKKSEALQPSPPSPLPTKISDVTPKTKKSAKERGGKSKKAKLPTPSPEPEVEPEESEAEENESNASEDDDTHLHGFSTDDDSSDEEDVVEAPAVDISTLPTIAKDDETVKRKLEKAKRQPTGDLGVLFLGRLPHGFYEAQLKAYFTQFGTVTRLRLSRNKKTGKSKHYAFIEFDSSSVAQIVADTMDNYLLMGHILRCKVIPRDQVHPELWIGANRKWRKVPRDRLARVEHNKPRTEEGQKRAAQRLLNRQQARKRKVEVAGIKYNFEAVSYKKPKQLLV